MPFPAASSALPKIFWAGFVAAFLVEVPGGVDVGVDPARHDSHPGKVYSGLVFGGADFCDLAVLNSELLVGEDFAFAIDDGGGLDDDWLSA